MGEIADAMIHAYMFGGAKDDEEAMEMAFGYGALTDDEDDDFEVNFLLCDEGIEDNAGVIAEGEDEADCWMSAILMDRVSFDGPALRLKPGITIEPFVKSGEAT